jgi:RNA polymerase sigma factor (sigma-70 family)
VDDLTRLVLSAQKGDLKAYERIVTRFQDMAYTAAAAYLRNHDRAQDAAQDAFVEAWVSLPKLKQPAAFPGWFRQILLRRCSRLSRRPESLPLEAADEVESEAPGPHQEAEEKERRTQLFAAVGALPEHERTVLELYYLTDCSYLQIAELLGLPLSTIKKRLYTARRRLRKTLDGTGRFSAPGARTCAAVE